MIVQLHGERTMSTRYLVSFGINGACCMTVRAEVEDLLNSLCRSLGDIFKLLFILPSTITKVQFLFEKFVEFFHRELIDHISMDRGGKNPENSSSFSFLLRPSGGFQSIYPLPS